MAGSIGTDNYLVMNQGNNPLVGFNFMLRVEGIYDLPCKSVRAFTKENEYEIIQEGGLNDYVHMRRKPISKPFTFEVERYVGVDYIDPLPNGAELMLPVILIVSRSTGRFSPDLAHRTYTFTGCTVTQKTYGELDAFESGLLTETITIAYRELLVVDLPWTGAVDVEFDSGAEQHFSLAAQNELDDEKKRRKDAQDEEKDAKEEYKAFQEADEEARPLEKAAVEAEQKARQAKRETEKAEKAAQTAKGVTQKAKAASDKAAAEAKAAKEAAQKAKEEAEANPTEENKKAAEEAAQQEADAAKKAAEAKTKHAAAEAKEKEAQAGAKAAKEEEEKAQTKADEARGKADTAREKADKAYDKWQKAKKG